MKNLVKIVSAWMAVCLAIQPVALRAEDIDIFVGSSGSTDRPNVLIVLDNTSNWARQSQQWPNGLQQGQSEVRAIKTVLSSIGEDINVGILEFVTNGTANDTGGFVRFPIWQMTPANKVLLGTQMDTIFGDITGVNEKRNANTHYGNLFYDVYNYFAGDDASNNTPNGTRTLTPPSARVNDGGYDSTWSNFKTPLASANGCAKNFVILISNPNASGPDSDTSSNNDALAALACDTSTIAVPNFSMTTTTTSSSLGNTSSCYSTIPTPATGQAACNANVTTEFPACGDGTYTGCTCDATPVTEPGACADGTLRYSVIGSDPAGTTNLGYMSQCVSNINQCDTSDYTTQCSGAGVSCACSATNFITTGCTGTKKKFLVQRTKTNTTLTNLGYTSSCYASQALCSTADYSAQCAAYPGGCACGDPTTTSSSCPDGTGRYPVSGLSDTIVATPDGNYNSTKGAPWHLDEWARCLYQKGVPVSGGDNQTATVYTIDVYNQQQNADHTALMLSTAKAGGGKYFAATNEAALEDVLKKIFQEITSVNSTFASASLPVNATNRAQNENQVFIGMFRPDPNALPRWFGNLKRYQLVLDADGVTVKLGDKDGNEAVNNNTGFIGDCASSFWTTDSFDPNDTTKGYWWNQNVSPNPASKCTSVPASLVYSDKPDGPTVEKGAVAEVIRKGNSPGTTDANPTWAVSRNFYTTNDYISTVLLSGSSNASALTTTQQSWIAGQDTQNEDVDLSLTETRGSLHGDVVHSRPLPVNYGSDTIVVYYGANDGNFRAVNAENGQELWTLVPYEYAQPAFVDRLRNNDPLVSYPNVDPSLSPLPKNYAWDGSIGIAQNADNTKVWIYPAMRRGGRRLYALDVTTPTSPAIKWIVGCNRDGTNCKDAAGVAGFEDIGQTWSTPNIAPVAGYATENVAFFGGGYDTCEDANSASPSCSTPKGAKVYAADAGSGALLSTFSTDRSVAADVALLDMDGDGKADYVYVADTGGSLYRIDLVTRTVSGSGVTYTARVPAAWTIRKIAVTAGAGRKFLFAPALFPVTSAGKVYLAIGSGDREHPLMSHYPYANSLLNPNRFYVYLDDLAVTSGAAADLDALENKTTDAGCNSTAITPYSTPTGWFMDLTEFGQGEQTVTSAVIFGGLIAFSTNRPIPPDAGSCTTILGEARGYLVNLTTGSGAVGVSGICGGNRSAVFVGGGLPPSPVIGTVPIGGKPVTVVIGAVQKEGGASTPISPQKVKPSITPIRKRIYWKLQGID